MSSHAGCAVPDRREAVITVLLVSGLLMFQVWGVSVRWWNGNLPGHEFRQAQTAITALFVQRDHDFSLAYPTPVLGKPWSIPFEFPLYQWTVVAVSNATGLPLIQAGRAVSVACFYLMLPALWLLLGRLGVAGTRRLLPLGMVLSCPLYFIYARSFMIETMALMFSLWFLHAFVAAVERRSWIWLVAANVAGLGAGLVKVTTFVLYLMPAGVWAVWWLWRARPQKDDATGGWRTAVRTAGWIAAATVVPIAASYGWVRFAEAVRTLNPSSRDLVSTALYRYNFGTWGTRLSAGIWKLHWDIIVQYLTPLPVLAGCAVLTVFVGCRWRIWIGWCVLFFIAVQALFPVIYASHDYYYAANAVLLMVAMGLVLAGLLEIPAGRPIIWTTIGILYAGLLWGYYGTYYEHMLRPSLGGNSLTEALRAVTDPDDVLIIAGEDWSSITPFYSQRRALMFRTSLEHDRTYVEEAFSRMAGEPVTALVLTGPQRANRDLLIRVAKQFGLDPSPAFTWHEYVVYLHQQLRPFAIETLLRRKDIIKLQVAPVVRPEDNPLLHREVPVASLLPRWRQYFREMHPQPVRYYSTFGLFAQEEPGRLALSAHPDTRLWFDLPAGSHRLSSDVQLDPKAYTGVPHGDASDGIEVIVTVISGKGRRTECYRRQYDPLDRPEDRGIQPFHVDVNLPSAGELELSVGPGPRGNAARDWVSLGPLTIR
jgi:hypothetical protein